MNQYYWKVKGENENYYIVYTENTKQLKTKVTSMTEHYQPKTGKIKAYQYKVVVGSDIQKQLFTELKLTEKDEEKETRKRRRKS